MKFKKIFSGFLAVASMLVGVGTVAQPFEVSASTIYIKQGDVDNDGYTSISDLVWISHYLHGMNTANSNEITRMDATRDGVIDYQDYNMVVNFNLGIGSPQTYYQEPYDSLNDETRSYYKYSYSNGSVVGTVQPYTLYLPGTNTNMLRSAKRALTAPTFIRDYSNINTVQITTSDGLGSGFIVGDHIVATAAHVISGGTSNNISIANNIKVKVYDATESSYVEYNVDSVHVPQDYFTTSSVDYNYDYALLHIDSQYDNDDNKTFEQYNAWNIGYMTSKFIADNGIVVASGFTVPANSPSGSTIHRYYSSGSIYDDSDTTDLRFHANAGSNGGDSGGPVYYNSDYNSEIIKSVVGNVTGGGLGADYKVWGCRMIPTIARFYLNNSNI